jgi:hypothetical protein
MSSNKFNSIQFIVTGCPVRNIERFICDIKGLLTESDVCTGKYLREVFVQTERRRSEVCADKPKANTFPYRPSKTRLINRLLYGSLNTFSDFHIFV